MAGDFGNYTSHNYSKVWGDGDKPSDVVSDVDDLIDAYSNLDSKGKRYERSIPLLLPPSPSPSSSSYHTFSTPSIVHSTQEAHGTSSVSRKKW